MRSFGGDWGVSYNESVGGVQDRFDRNALPQRFSGSTVYIDHDLLGETASVELWSDGASRWNAGGGLIFQITSAGMMNLYVRRGSSVPVQNGPALPAGGRLRLRLVKGAGTTSTLHVDRWNGSAFVADYHVFTVTDDHFARGRFTAVANYLGGRRGVLRVTVVPNMPAGALTVVKDPEWSSDWKLFQRDARDHADIPVRAWVTTTTATTLQARIVRTTTGAPLRGHDWGAHDLALSAKPAGDLASFDVTGVDAGGNYNVELRLRRDSDSSILGTGTIAQVAVGDVFLAGGQSNMSGYSGNLVGAETPIDEAHLFHNDGTWKRASEPMDDGTDQVDLVSAEGPLHSLMLRFAKDVYASTGVPVGIIVGSLGGTNLYSQWQRDESDHANRGTLYGSLLARALLQGSATPPAGFLWYQGESDAGRGTVAYRADLERLLAQYRADTGNPRLFAVIMQLGTYTFADRANWMAIQEAEREVAEADDDAILVTTCDQPLSDVIHMNVTGYQTIGARAAAGTIETLFRKHGDALAELVKITAPRGNVLKLVYDAPVNGGEVGLFTARTASGPLGISAVQARGRTVTLTLDAAPTERVYVSYGEPTSNTHDWLRGDDGTAVAIFQDVVSGN